MNRRMRTFLLNLVDGKYHVYDKLPYGIGPLTVQACIDSGFVATKKVGKRRDKDGVEIYKIALRITRDGKNALAKAYPVPSSLSKLLEYKLLK